MQDMQEQQLVKALRAGAPGAAAALVQQYGGLLKAVALRHAPPGQWEDALNEGLLAIWQNIRRYDPAAGSFKSWAAAVVRYRAIDLGRRQNREEPAEVQRLDALGGSAPDRYRVELQELFAALPPADRELLLRRYFYGYTAGQIAKAQGENPNTVNTRVARAKRKLLRLYRKGEPDEK